jgi:hypothetical protein
MCRRDDRHCRTWRSTRGRSGQPGFFEGDLESWLPQEIERRVDPEQRETRGQKHLSSKPLKGLGRPAEALAKAELGRKLAEVIAKRRLTQAAAAELLNIDQPKVSALDPVVT